MRTTRHLLSLYGIEEFDGRYERLNESVFPDDVPALTEEVRRAFCSACPRGQPREFRIVRQTDQQLRWIESRNLIFYADTHGFELLRKPYGAEELSRVHRRAIRARD